MKDVELTREEIIQLDKESYGSYTQMKKLIEKGLHPHCTCLYCGKTFDSGDVKEINVMNEKDGQQTICCPYCDVDSVVIDHMFKKKELQRIHNIIFESETTSEAEKAILAAKRISQ